MRQVAAYALARTRGFHWAVRLVMATPKTPLSYRIFASHGDPERDAGWMNESRRARGSTKKRFIRARAGCRLLQPAGEVRCRLLADTATRQLLAQLLIVAAVPPTYRARLSRS